ncbi:hypothetical protein [Algibacillus agarilyticus]|uniref:hypothetical protein n=1 Tax=Algibacillus agarilyticus TaxID=2234133 RepID=UPI000DCFEA44|nr:hypothetical protein [Algibacillus agarilyticus]
MRKLLATPVNMDLSDAENAAYQNVLKYVADLTLNLMAVKVEDRPSEFLAWCKELNDLCRTKLDLALLEPEQLLPLKKLQDVLEAAISAGQLKLLRIAPWPVFCDYIEQQNELQAVEERLRLVKFALTVQSTPLADMIEEDRLAIAGKHMAKHDISNYDFDIEWFASTKAAKAFHTLLADFPAEFDTALNHIPLTGEVTKEQYLEFVEAFKHIFAQNDQKAPLAPATRLLAMRRPDQFVALNNAKIDLYCQGFGIAKFNSRDFNGYWSELITSVRACSWWKQAEPENEDEKLLWQARAMLVDVFLYADETAAQNSNFIKMREKPRKSSSKAIKRSKESVDVLVDRALQAEGIPSYLLEKRESIIHQVKQGKSVDQVIKLLRTIFG